MPVIALNENKKTALLILIAFVFSFSVRFIWVGQFNTYDNFKFNNEFMINTNDGYYFAEGARDILKGSHEPNDLSPVEVAASMLTAFFVKILPVSFETLIFYFPAFLGSLVVVPIILIGRSFYKIEVGFIAALIGSIAWSYYNRTMVGYYDTDMLNIVFPTLLLWSLIWAIRTKEEKYLLFTGLEIIVYRWWYPQSYALEFAFFTIIALYTLYLFVKKQEIRYELKLMATVMLAMVNLPVIVRLIFVVGIYFVAKMELALKYLYAILGAAIAIFVVTGGLTPIWGKIQGYVFRETTTAATDGLNLQFFNVLQTIREAGQIPFGTFAERISGHIVSFILAIIGYIWFALKHPALWITLPMVGLGFMAYGIPGLINGGGLRFTIYAVPPMALGIAYLIVELSYRIAHEIMQKQHTKAGEYVIASVLTLLVLIPNIKHIQEYKVPTVFEKQEVQTLDKFKNIATREDYVVTWWDYGYPIRYYSDVKTLVDGGKHSGVVNFAPSFILTSPIQSAANLARLDVEYTEKQFDQDNATKMASSTIEQMTLDYGFKNANDFLDSLETDIKLPPKTRDVYLYLPFRMMSIFPTVALFSNLDLHSGEEKRKLFFYKGAIYKNENGILSLGQGITFDTKTNIISFGNDQKTQIKYFIVTQVDNSGKSNAQTQMINESSQISLIYMKSYNSILVVNDAVLASTYIRLFVLEDYDKNLFEPVILEPLTKIYRLKI
jgi:dolichyl-diphosphooligosaccharide--protein glycosyltransferase/undecaprenyl-diphosphooligosaccharide--protein glycosyltransferase